MWEDPVHQSVATSRGILYDRLDSSLSRRSAARLKNGKTTCEDA
jgi:hypothetical protein